MKKINLILVVLLALTTTVAFAQNKQAYQCPPTPFAGTKADSVFHLSSGKTIVLCGYKNTDDHPVTYSEFVLAVARQDSIIGFWGAVTTCRFEVKQDTLLVKEQTYLPVGEGFQFKRRAWAVDKIYFSDEKPVNKRTVSRFIPTYTPAEIKKVLTAYETANPAPKMAEKNINIAAELLIATISGSSQARAYFEAFPDKIKGLGAHLSEIYDRYQRMLKLWDEKTSEIDIIKNDLKHKND